MREVLITVQHPVVDGEVEQDHYLVEIPKVTDPGGYVQYISLSYFHDRELKRAFPELPEGTNWLAYADSIKYATVDWDPNYRLSNLGLDRSQIPVCKSLWDFYELAGYDRKAKRWLV